jgi:hypothetical protein
LQGGVVVLHNQDIERNGSKIYTWTMFEQFGQSIYKGFTYCVEEIEEDMMYNYNATTQGTQMWRGVKNGAESSLW